MKVKPAVLAMLAAAALFVTGCIDVSLPVYQRIDQNGLEDEEGIVVIVEGAEYKMFPERKWSVEPGEMIGYAGSWKTTAYAAAGDTERHFVYLHDAGSSMYYSPLYRTDKPIPEPSGDTVNKISYSETHFSGDEKKQIKNTIIDKETIQAFFDGLETDERTSNIVFLEDFYIHISCYSDAVPGASYYLNIVSGDGKLMCGNHREGYVELPAELLERIAGHTIDLKMLPGNE